MSDNKEQEVIAPPLDQKALFDLGHGLLSNMKDQQLRNHEIHLAQIEVQKMQYAGSKLAFLYRY